MARFRLLTLLSLFAKLTLAQESPRPVSLEEAVARLEPDFRPKLAGATVIVEGVVALPPIEAPDAVYLGIRSEKPPARGLMLVFAGDNRKLISAMKEIHSGEVVEATGTIAQHAGQAVVKPTALRIFRSAEPPQPLTLKPAEAAALRYLGLLVTVEGVVSEYREASSGDTLEFTDSSAPGAPTIKIFLPILRQGAARPLAAYVRGDRIRARGLVNQFCLSPPYNRYFQLLVPHAMNVELIEGAPVVSPRLLPATVLLILLGIVGAWLAQQRSAKQNRTVQRMLDTGEALSSATTAREVADQLRAGLLDLIPAQSIDVYRYDEERKYLERVPDSNSSQTHAFHLDEAHRAPERALALAVRNRAILQFANTQNASLLNDSQGPARALLIVPIRRREEVRGALLVTAPAGLKLLSESLHPALSHLASDAGLHLDHLEQAALREQIHRSEKLSVAGQLIHGVLTELHEPLESIRNLSEKLGPSQGDAIREQVRKASETVSRIISVARAEQMDSRPVDLQSLFKKMEVPFRAAAKNESIEFEFSLSSEAVHVLGSHAQLEKVFDNLLAHATFAAAHSLEKLLSLSLRRVARSAMIEISFTGPFGEGEGPDFSATALGLAVSRGLLQSHGGDVRFVTIRPGHYRYEAELPSLSANVLDEGSGGLTASSIQGQLTALLVEPDRQTQRRILSIFGELNHRLIPVSSLEDAADLAEKVRFDLVLSSTRPEGGTWAELFHRVHHRTPHFAVMSESAALAEDGGNDLLDGRSASMIPKPVQQHDIAQLLGRLEQRN
jgi:signal transduction histidine kinase